MSKCFSDRNEALQTQRADDGMKVLKAVPDKPGHALADLLRQCNLRASEPEELALWHAIRPVGLEV